MAMHTAVLTPLEKNRSLGLVAVGHGVAHWYNGILSVLYPVLTVYLGLNYSQVGLFDSSRGVVAIVVSLAGGYMADNFGRRRLLLAACLVSLGIFIGLLGFASTFIVALILLTLAGIGNNLWHPYAIPFLRSIFPNRKALALALHDASANTFHGLAPIAVGALLIMYSWQSVTRLHLWPGLIMGLLILVALPRVVLTPTTRTERADYRQAWGSGILRNRQFLLGSGVSASMTMARLGFFTFLPLFLAFELGLDSLAQGIHMGVLTFAGALLAPLAGTLADRFGVRRVLPLSILIAGIGAIAIAAAEAGILLYLMVALLGAALFSTRSLILVYVMSVTPEQLGGSSIGAIFSLNRFFGIFSPLAAGLLADRLGLRAVFYFFAALLAVGFLLALNMRPSPQRIA